MHTIILQTKARQSSTGKTWRIEVLGDSLIKEDVKVSIGELEYHPAKAERRALIDILTIIERHNFRICHVEHKPNDDDLEEWMFILQG